jgi:hypothetical protein
MRRLSLWAELRSAPVVATAAMFVLVMAYSLLGHPLLHLGSSRLLSPDDLWTLDNASTAVLHGHLTRVYVPNEALTSPPGILLALLPAMAVGQVLGLSPHLHASGAPQSMWFVLGPTAFLLGSTLLFALDAVARAWSFSPRARLALALVAALGVANVVVMWGHPEDCIALALVIWAALAVDRDGEAAVHRAAWLLGVGVVLQPLAVLGIVPVLARFGWRAGGAQWWRLALPSVVLVIFPLVAEPHETLYVLLHQPFELAHNSYTPLTHLAPSIGNGLNGGGPTRLVAVLLAATLAAAVCHRHHGLVTVLGIVAASIFIRVLLETELNWYYLWPLLALCLLLSLRRSVARFGLCAGASVATMFLGNRIVHHIDAWWPALIALLCVSLLSALPPPRRWIERVSPHRGAALPT